MVGTAPAIVPAKREDHELDERRRALHRFAKIGVAGWTAFALSDVFASLAYAHGRHLFWLLGLRLTGTLLGLGFAAFLARPLGARQVGAIEIVLFVTAGVLVSLMAIPFGGITSFLLQGVTIVALLHAVLPTHGARTAFVGGLTALTFPATMFFGAFFSVELRHQWQTPAMLLAFANNYIFVLLATAIAAFAGHIQWKLRRELYEARRLGTYRLKAPIARGDVGSLWLARQEPLGRDVALKVLGGTDAMDPDAVARFMREAKAASQLVHPNTIRIFDFGASDDGVLFIAMELLGGLDAEGIVRLTGPMPPARAIYLARQACLSLAEAHDRGIVHRDVRPDNLFVTQVADDLDFVKVLDFGVARVSPRDVPGRKDGARIHGAPAFVAPEQIVGASVDARSDVYSLGGVLYFMVTGTAPFEGLSAADTLMAHLGKEPEEPSLRTDRQRVPYDLERTILRCLAKSPADRYPNMRELEIALGACADAERWNKDDAREYWAGLQPTMQFVRA